MKRVAEKFLAEPGLLSPSSRASILNAFDTPGLSPGLHSVAIFDGSLNSLALQINNFVIIRSQINRVINPIDNIETVPGQQ
jgi:hypothetical protein